MFCDFSRRSEENDEEREEESNGKEVLFLYKLIFSNYDYNECSYRFVNYSV